MTSLLRGVFLCGLYSLTFSLSAAPQYTIQTVPFKGLLNDQGKIVGIQDITDNNGNIKGSHTFLWQNGNTLDLGALQTSADGYSYSTPIAMNANGQITGYSPVFAQNSNYAQHHAFIWSNGVMTDLGYLGVDINGLGDSIPTDINARGQVVGHSGGHAFLWQDGTMLDLDPATLQAPEYTGQSEAVAINDNGQVLLNTRVNYPSVLSATRDYQYDLVYEASRPLVWTNGSFRALNSTTVHFDIDSTTIRNRVIFGSGVDINNNGTVLGTMLNGFPYGGFAKNTIVLWNPDQTFNLFNEFQYMTTQGKPLIAQGKLNTLGQVAAIYSTFPYAFFVVSFNGLTFESIPLGAGLNCSYENGSLYLNDKGLIAASHTCEHSLPYSIENHAFLYENGTVTDLNTLIPADSGWSLTDVYAINNAGQLLVGGNKGYALLTPSIVKQASCDVNDDKWIDKSDLMLIYHAKGTQQGTYDINGDGVVNLYDLRKCVVQCSKPVCAL